MEAAAGDRLVIRGHSVGAHALDGEILEVLGENGGPPYLVRWSDDGRTSRIFPGSDAFVERYAHGPGSRTQGDSGQQEKATGGVSR